MLTNSQLKTLADYIVAGLALRGNGPALSGRPHCFGSQPGPQSQAEHGCHDCPHAAACLGAAPQNLPLVPRRLTVGQFARCIGKCEEVVRRRIRERYIDRRHVAGPPYFIDRAALAKFGVTLEAAAERLQPAPPVSAPAHPPIPAPAAQQTAA